MAERVRQVGFHLLSTLRSVSLSTPVQDPNQLPWNPDSTVFPSRKELPKIPGVPEEAAWVWGKDDEVSRLVGIDGHMLMAQTDRTSESLDSHESQSCCGGDQDGGDHSTGVSIRPCLAGIDTLLMK